MILFSSHSDIRETRASHTKCPHCFVRNKIKATYVPKRCVFYAPNAGKSLTIPVNVTPKFVRGFRNQNISSDHRQLKKSDRKFTWRSSHRTRKHARSLARLPRTLSSVLIAAALALQFGGRLRQASPIVLALVRR